MSTLPPLHGGYQPRATSTRSPVAPPPIAPRGRGAASDPAESDVPDAEAGFGLAVEADPDWFTETHPLGPDGFTPLAPDASGGCTPCMVCGGSQDRGWHKHPNAAQWELGNRLRDERDRYRTAWKSAATREGVAADEVERLTAERDRAVMVADSMQHFADVAEVCERKSNQWAACAEAAEAEAERTREALALGAAWALGDDEGTLADLREQVASLTTQRNNAERKHERLESGIEALANEWERTHRDQLPHLGCLDMYRHCADLLRALLPGAAS